MATARLGNFEPFTAKHLQSFRLFCLHGENDALIRERAAALRTAFGADGTVPAIVDIHGDVLAGEPFGLADEIGSLSLFAERRVVRVTLGARVAQDAFANALPLLADAGDVLIIVDAGVDKRQEPTTRLLASDTRSLVVPCPPDAPRDLVRHARSVLAEAGIDLDEATARELVDFTDGDRGLLVNELTKLLLLGAPGEPLTADVVRAAVADDAGAGLDDAAERIFAGDVLAALEATDRLATTRAGSAPLVGAALRRALWTHRAASGEKAKDLRRAIARLNEAVQADRSSDRLADARGALTLARTAQFFRR